MYMTFRRLRAWPRVGGGFFDYGQQSSLATFLTINFTILILSIFVDDDSYLITSYFVCLNANKFVAVTGL